MNEETNSEPTRSVASEPSEAPVRSSDGLGRCVRITARTLKYLAVVLCFFAVMMLVVTGVCMALDAISKMLVPLLWLAAVTTLCALAAWAEECSHDDDDERPNDQAHAGGA